MLNLLSQITDVWSTLSLLLHKLGHVNLLPTGLCACNVETPAMTQTMHRPSVAAGGGRSGGGGGGGGGGICPQAPVEGGGGAYAPRRRSRGGGGDRM